MARDSAVTIDAVARSAGVSRQTVSNALNAPDRLARPTLERVLGVVAELGYQPNRAARSLRTRASRLVGLRIDPSVPGTAGSLHDRFLHALTEGSTGEGYHLLLFTPPDPADELSGFTELLATTGVDAFVLTDTHRGDRRLRWLTEREAPFVAFGRPWQRGPDHAWVDVDGAAGTRAAVAHLVGLGHRRVGFVGWPAGSDVGEDRLAGWRDGCAAAGLPTAGLTTHGADGVAEGARAAASLLDGPGPAGTPTALVCASDTLAMGVLGLLHRRGLRAGHDLAVCGFDDTAAASVVPPGLTSVRQPLEDVAHAIASRLAGLLDGRPPSEHGRLLTPALVVRGSTDPTVRTHSTDRTDRTDEEPQP